MCTGDQHKAEQGHVALIDQMPIDEIHIKRITTFLNLTMLEGAKSEDPFARHGKIKLYIRISLATACCPSPSEIKRGNHPVPGPNAAFETGCWSWVYGNECLTHDKL